jgi:hypothetical protein
MPGMTMVTGQPRPPGEQTALQIDELQAAIPKSMKPCETRPRRSTPAGYTPQIRWQEGPLPG